MFDKEMLHLMRNRKRLLVFVILMGFLASFLPSLSPAAQADAGDVTYVSTLEELRKAVTVKENHIVLSNNISGSVVGNLISITGRGVTLDLNGHTLSNSSTTYHDSNGYATTVSVVRINSTNVRVTNGIIAGGTPHTEALTVSLDSGAVEIDRINTSGQIGGAIEVYCHGEGNTVHVSNCMLIVDPECTTGAIYSSKNSKVIIDNTTIYCGGNEGDTYASTYPAFLSSQGGRILLSDVKVNRRCTGYLFEVSSLDSKPYYGDFLVPYASMQIDGVSVSSSTALTHSNYVENHYYGEGKTIRVSTEPEPVGSVAVSLTAPSIGSKPSYDVTIPMEVYRGVASENPMERNMCWYDLTAGAYVDKNEGVFLEGHQYRVTLLLNAEPGYEISRSPKAKINGASAEATYLSSTGQMQVEYTFPVLEATPSISVQPKSLTCSSGATAVFQISAAGGALQYQWQYSMDNGKTWHNSTMTGYNTASMSVPVISGRNGYLYHCIVKNSKGEVTSQSAKLTVSGVKPVIRDQTNAITSAVSVTVTFKVAAAGSNLSYKWQYSSDNGKTWHDSTMTGCNTSGMKVPVISGRNGYLYHCIVSNSYGSVTSSPAKLTVSGVKPVIRDQTKAITSAPNVTVTFKVAAAGVGLKYKWQYSNDSGKTWHDSTMTGHNTAAMKVPVIKGRNGYQYRCIVSNSYGSTTSSPAKLTVK